MIRTVLILLLGSCLTIAADRPNILWITLEDTSPQFIGCYGNKSARTPNIDALAARGIRFDQAFANAPVCSAARSTIITGIINERLGTGNHRSSLPIPEHIKGFPTALRANGYYTSNNKKTDYSTSAQPRLVRESWNESSNQAGWWNRAPEQPFFSVFNIEDCHQSRTMTWSYDWYRKNIFEKLRTENRVADTAFPVPPFLPDTPALRKHFARIHNSIARADERVGDLLARLAADGLTEDTIIFCFADHGEAMPRGKANAIGLGYRVPFIIAFPKKWQHLNPWGNPGTPSDELICFDDLGPTMHSLTGSKPDPSMTGRAILGDHRTPPRPYIFGSRNRIDESAGCSRSITDGRFLYTRHFLPGAEYKYLKYFDVADISRLLRSAHRNGTLDDYQRAMFQPQPHEVLYDLHADPWEITNLAPDPAHQERLHTLRKALFTQLREHPDLHLLPEYELARIAAHSTPYEFASTMSKEQRQALVQAADLASQPDANPEILNLAKSNDPVLTYWAATALRSNPDYARSDLSLDDFSYPPAKLEFAAALVRFDDDPQAKATLADFARSEDSHLRLHALQLIQSFGPKAAPFKDSLEEALKGGTYDTRCSAEVTLHLLEGRPISYPDPRW
jgi:arylsulfatase A-like enzyme